MTVTSTLLPVGGRDGEGEEGSAGKDRGERARPRWEGEIGEGGRLEKGGGVEGA